MNGSILVVEEEVPVRQQLAANLKDSGYQVLCAADVVEAEAVVQRVRPDLVLFDWILPGVPGLKFSRRLRSDQRTRDVSLVLISGRTHEDDKVAALEGGADDYITKPYSPRELLARVKAVLRRRAPQLAEEVVEIDGLYLDPSARYVRTEAGEIELWTTEFRLLHFFMIHPTRIFSRGRLLDEIWGHDSCLEERTVDVHIRRLRQKLTPSGHGGLIETVRGLGYRLNVGGRLAPAASSGSVRILPAEHYENRLQQDEQIELQGPTANVREIVFNA